MCIPLPCFPSPIGDFNPFFTNFQGFEFLRNLLTLLLQHGLDPNVRFSQTRFTHILLSLMDMVQNARFASDLNYVYDMTLTLMQYGANPNVFIDPDPDQVRKEKGGRVGFKIITEHSFLCNKLGKSSLTLTLDVH